MIGKSVRVAYQVGTVDAQNNITKDPPQFAAFSRAEIVWALVTVGKSQQDWNDSLKLPDFFFYDMVSRIGLLKANLTHPPKTHRADSTFLGLSPIFDKADPSEKNYVSYIIGMTVAKLFAAQREDIDAPWLQHFDNYANARQQQVSSDVRFDLIGQRAAKDGEMAFVEAKGRTSKIRPKDLEKAILQVRGEGLNISGTFSQVKRVISIWHFATNKKDRKKFRMQESEPIVELLYVDSQPEGGLKKSSGEVNDSPTADGSDEKEVPFQGQSFIEILEMHLILFLNYYKTPYWVASVATDKASARQLAAQGGGLSLMHFLSNRVPCASISIENHLVTIKLDQLDMSISFHEDIFNKIEQLVTIMTDKLSLEDILTQLRNEAETANFESYITEGHPLSNQLAEASKALNNSSGFRVLNAAIELVATVHKMIQYKTSYQETNSRFMGADGVGIYLGNSWFQDEHADPHHP